MIDYTATLPTCDALTVVERVKPGGWGVERIPCTQTRGLSAFLDYNGQTRRACGAWGHAADVVRRFGVAERTHADHDEPDEECWDCQEGVAATWHDVMAGF